MYKLKLTQILKKEYQIFIRDRFGRKVKNEKKIKDEIFKQLEIEDSNGSIKMYDLLYIVYYILYIN